MDPVVRLLASLDSPATPRAEFRDALLARLLAQLEASIGRKPEARASDRFNGRGSSILRPLTRRRGRMALAITVLAAAAVAALFVSTPWKTAPGFLEQVQAALTPPPGRILHVKWDATFTSENPACTSTLRHEFWIDTKPPHRYRAIVPVGSASLDPRGFPCGSTGPRAEVGGDLGKPNLRFEPPNRLVPDRALYFSSVNEDPWAFARKLISEGRAHRE